MLRIVEYCFRGALLNNVALLHHHNPVGNLFDHTQIVADEYDGTVVLFPQFQKQIEDGLLNGDIKGCRGLICDDEGRFIGYCHGNHDPLELTA